MNTPSDTPSVPVHQADLFWFSRPKLMLGLIQGTVFLSALSIATLSQTSKTIEWFVFVIISIVISVLLYLLHAVRSALVVAGAP